MTSTPQTPRFNLLDFGPEPIFSDPFEVEIKGRTVLAVFAEISGRQKDRLRIQAVMEIQTQRSAEEEKNVARFGEWSEEFFEVATQNTWAALILQEVLRDADNHEKPLFSRDVFELIPAGTVLDLSLRFEQWEAGLSPAMVTEEKIREFIEAVKKNLPASALWRHYGSSILWGSLRFLVEQQSTYQTEASSDT
jgi:hypothetical protein